jgi:hypothetical protein
MGWVIETRYADAADLALGHPGVDAQGGHQVVDLAGRHAVDEGLHDHGPQGAVDAPARLEERGEERALAQLGDVQLDVTGLGREEAAARAVAVSGALGGPLVSLGADHLGGLEVDQLLEDERHRVAQYVGAATGPDGSEQVGQGRL